MKTCAVIIWDRAATQREGRLVTRACGAPTGSVVMVGDDPIFAACHRHKSRLVHAFPSMVAVTRAGLTYLSPPRDDDGTDEPDRRTQ